jgi:DNA polymerase III epsilon subunit-like protein
MPAGPFCLQTNVCSYQTMVVLFVDPTTRLADVSFCVLDLETTGTSDEFDEIVEVGAVLVRGGQRLGTLQTMVRHPLEAGPSDRPPIESVLASLLEFIRGAVIVGHNVRFDLRFLNAALRRGDRDVVLAPSDAIDTVALARLLLRDDADDCRLGTLAQRFQFERRPNHRALADAEATVELLHLLIERATHYGALDLDDLARLPRLLRHRHRSKLPTTAAIPRASGVACLLGRYDEVLHVIEATDLRGGVRQLFDPEPDDPSTVVASAVLHRLHRVVTVETDHPLVSRLAALRWRAAVVPARPVDVAYLRLASSRSGRSPRRLRVTTDREARDIVAGPMPRAQARRVVASLASLPSDHTAWFLAAMQAVSSSPPALDDSLELSLDGADLSVVRDVVQQQSALAAARSLHGSIAVGDAVVVLDDGCVLDIVTDGRSWAHQLPPPGAGDQPGRPPSAARALEAMFVGQLIQGRAGFSSARTG